MTSELKKLVQVWTEEVWNQKNMSVLNDCFSEEFIGHDPYQETIRGRAGVSAFVEEMQAAFPDQNVRIDDTVEAGDEIACRLTVSGEHKGEFMGRMATGAEITFPVMCWWRVENGRFCKLWQHWDALGVLTQINNANGIEPMTTGLVYDMEPAPAALTTVSAAEMESNKAVVRVWMNGAWNYHRLGLANELMAEDFWFWDPFGPVITDRKGFCEWADVIDAAFPNRSLSIDHLIAQENKTAYRVTLKAKHEGDFLVHKPTGRDVNASAMIIAMHEDGQFKKAWQIFDVLNVLQQIGVA